MKRHYPYLTNTKFLDAIYDQHNQSTFVEITVLDWWERPIKQVQGRVINGSVSLNGDSSIRRTANLTVKILDESELYTNIDSLFSINKKIFIETGLKNNLRHLGNEYYPEYETIWFPFGTFVITGYSVNHDSSGITVSLSLSDKMALLNGTAGGIIPTSVNFESYDTLGPDGDLHSEYIRINQMLVELVNHFGGEDLNNIVINDVPNKIKQVLRWVSANPLYLLQSTTNNKDCVYTTIGSQNVPTGYTRTQFTYGFDCGYTYTDFVYPGELGAGAGDSVCTVLDKVKETLGNYEYYYDVFGHFIFQEIKNYVNTTEWRTAFNNYVPGTDIELPYAYNKTLNSHVYDFSKHNFAISYSNAPKYDMIKNDFVVWGTRKSTTGINLPCRYHLAIDERPKLDSPWNIVGSSIDNSLLPNGVCFVTHMDDYIRKAHPITAQFDTLSELEEKKPVGITGIYYLVNEPNIQGIYTWITDIKRYETLYNNYMSAGRNNDATPSEEEKVDTTIQSGYMKLPLTSYYTATGSSRDIEESGFVVKQNTDWRNILYWKGLIGAANGVDTGYYWTELCNEWPKIYDVENDEYKEDVLKSPSSFDWWLDIINQNSALNKFSVQSIGRRSYAKTDSGCNCVFEPAIPDIVMVDIGDQGKIVDSRTRMELSDFQELGLIPIQVKAPIYNSTGTGGIFNSCYEHVKQILQDYVDYNESINITCLPIYHLEPNTRIHVEDAESGIYGDYIINTLSYTLGNAGTMTISAKKVIEKI